MVFKLVQFDSEMNSSWPAVACAQLQSLIFFAPRKSDEETPTFLFERRQIFWWLILHLCLLKTPKPPTKEVHSSMTTTIPSSRQKKRGLEWIWIGIRRERSRRRELDVTFNSIDWLVHKPGARTLCSVGGRPRLTHQPGLGWPSMRLQYLSWSWS
jgi:hypothetical protein